MRAFLVCDLADRCEVLHTLKWMSTVRMGCIFVPTITAELDAVHFDEELELQASSFLETAGAPVTRGALFRMVCLRILQGRRRTRLAQSELEILAVTFDTAFFDYPKEMSVTSHQHTFQAPPSFWEMEPQVLRRDITAQDKFYTRFAELQQAAMIRDEGFQLRFTTTSVVQKRWREVEFPVPTGAVAEGSSLGPH